MGGTRDNDYCSLMVDKLGWQKVLMAPHLLESLVSTTFSD